MALIFLLCIITIGLDWIAKAQHEEDFELGSSSSQGLKSLAYPLSPDHRPSMRVGPFHPAQYQTVDPAKLVLTYLAYNGRQWQRPEPYDLNPNGEGASDEQYYPFTRMQLWIYPHSQPAIPVNSQNAAWAVTYTLSVLLSNPDKFPPDAELWEVPSWVWATAPHSLFAASRIVVDNSFEPINPLSSGIFVDHWQSQAQCSRNAILLLITRVSQSIWAYDDATHVKDVFHIDQSIRMSDPTTGTRMVLYFLHEGTTENPTTFGVLADALRWFLAEMIKDKTWYCEDGTIFVPNLNKAVAFISIAGPGSRVNEPNQSVSAAPDPAVWQKVLPNPGLKLSTGDGGGNPWSAPGSVESTTGSQTGSPDRTVNK